MSEDSITAVINYINWAEDFRRTEAAICRLNPERTKRMKQLREQFAKIQTKPAPVFAWSRKDPTR